MLTMNDQRARNRKLNLQQIERFLRATKEVRFEVSERSEVYNWIERLLCQQEYMRQGRRGRAYCGATSGK